MLPPAVLHAARVEYAEWFANLGARPALRMAPGGPGVHKDRRILTAPWCGHVFRRGRRRGRVCGRAAKAKGLCLTHYVSEQRRAARRAAGCKQYGATNTACGHLDRPHHAHGRCHACDRTARRRAAPRPRRAPRTGLRCGHAGRRPHAFGLCGPCYFRRKRRGTLPACRMPRPAHAVGCHPDRPHFRHGLCSPCWYRAYRARTLHPLAP